MLNDPADFGIQYQTSNFKSIDGLNLNAWWFPANKKSKATIIFLHGNGENISTHFAAVSWLSKADYNVFIFDYRGYGLSEGEPTLKMTISDIQQALNYVNLHNKTNEKIFIIAQSLGASMGIYALSQENEGLHGIIFVSPFSDYREITQNILSKSWLTWPLQWPLSLTINNDYSPLKFVAQLPQIPILYLYSTDDKMIPAAQVQALFNKTSPPKFIEHVRGGHNSILGITSNRDLILHYLNNWRQTYKSPITKKAVNKDTFGKR